jgi:YfiH family protein
MTPDWPESDWLLPEWPAPPAVKALSTTRSGGVSQECWASLNLGEGCGDDPASVAENRRRLRAHLPAEPVWLRQVHGCRVADLDEENGAPPEADAAVSRRPGRVCAVLAADCLPVLMCDRMGACVAAAHAGWRGLAAGVLEATVEAMGVPADELLAWLGPAIGPTAYPVGAEVRDALLRRRGVKAGAFRPAGDRWRADLYMLARQLLAAAGVRRVYGGDWCTYSEPERFYSYRRDGRTGRMASLVWLG